MTQNEAILDHLLHIRAALDEICSDVSEVKTSLGLIENHVAKCVAPRLHLVPDAPGVASF